MADEEMDNFHKQHTSNEPSERPSKKVKSESVEDAKRAKSVQLQYFYFLNSLDFLRFDLNMIAVPT